MKRNTCFLVLILFVLQSLAQEISPKRLNILLTKAEQTHSNALILYKDNKLVTEKYWGTAKPEDKIATMSCTKSIVGLAVACLLSDGLIDSLNTPICKYFPEWRQGLKKNITIRHLINMTSGIQNIPDATIEIYPSPDFVQLALCAELVDEPGKVFSYNNKSVNLISALIKKITGKRMDIYLGDRLFKPLGITDFTWSLDSVANPQVMSGCKMRPNDFIKIGLLLLNQGKYLGRQVITEKNMEEVIKPAAQYAGYGMLWWIDHENTISIIDDEIINALKKARVNEDFVKQMILLTGVYNSDKKYTDAVKKVFGEDGIARINEIISPLGLKIRKKQFTGSTTYRADGYLGNYIIVNPQKKIAAIRMISTDRHKFDSDNFVEFRDMILNLSNADASFDK